MASIAHCRDVLQEQWLDRMEFVGQYLRATGWARAGLRLSRGQARRDVLLGQRGGA